MRADVDTSQVAGPGVVPGAARCEATEHLCGESGVRWPGRRLSLMGLCLAWLVVCVIGCGPKNGPSPIYTPELSAGPTLALSATFTPTYARPTLTRVPTRTPMRVPTQTPTWTPTWTPSPTSTSSPTPDPGRRAVAFVSDISGDDDVYLMDLATGDILNLTHSPGEDRDPAFAPDGHSLVFRSNAEGAWAFYRVDLMTGRRIRVEDNGYAGQAYRGRIALNPMFPDRYAYDTYRDGSLNVYVHLAQGTDRALAAHPAGDYGPAWSPDGARLAFASWREGQKDLYMVEQPGDRLVRLTTGPADEEEPAWHPGGKRLVYVCWRDQDTDLCELDLESGAIQRLTDSPYPDRSPAYAEDGTLFWTRYVPGKPFELHDPYYPGRWRLWMRGQDGVDRPVSLPVDDMDVYTPAAAWVTWRPAYFPALERSVATSTPTPSGQAELYKLDIWCAGGDPRLREDLIAPYQAWREAILAQTGYDFLGRVSDMFRPLGYSNRNYGHLSWHRTGRAVDLLFEWHDPEEGPNQLMVVREDLGAQTYWRLYLKCRAQDGTMGEPLTAAPWLFWFNLDPSIEPQAFAAGGRPDVIPEGYYVDVTRLAMRYGWHRIASYEEADYDWRTDSVGREFWHYQRTDGLTWWQAMSQLYPPEVMEAKYGWDVCTDKLGLSAEWLRGKGIPTPMPVRPQ